MFTLGEPISLPKLILKFLSYKVLHEWIPKTGELKRIPMQQKGANAKNFAYKRGFEVKFARLTADVIIHAIPLGRGNSWE